MPELPEVETVRRGLFELLIGKNVKTVSCDNQKSFPNAKTDVDVFLINAKITNIRRRGKMLFIDLSSKYSLIVHLKMTGQMVYVGDDSQQRFGAGHPNRSLVNKLPDSSTRVTIGLGEAKLFFNDQRKFGWMRLEPTIEIDTLDYVKKLGPEPIEQGFTAKDFIERLLRRKNSNIKSVLLDQTVMAGVGNIYADESLWGAMIHPTMLVKNLSKKQINKLLVALKYVLELAIEQGGSSDKNYVDAEGKKGSYMKFAKVFRREGQACPRCGYEIVKSRVAGRGTHTCPNCQKANTK